MCAENMTHFFLPWMDFPCSRINSLCRRAIQTKVILIVFVVGKASLSPHFTTMKPKYCLVRVRATRRFFLPGILATALALAWSVKSSQAQTLHWDSNDVTAGAGATPTGTWGTSTFWSTSASGEAATAGWTSGGTAVFSAGSDAINAYTVTLSGTQTIGGLTVEEGTPTISGGTALALNAASTPFNITGTANIGSVISGTGFGLVKSGAGLLSLTGINTFTGKTSITGGTISIAADSGLGAAPGAAVADQLTLDGGALRVTVGNQTLNANRGITLGAGGGVIDSSSIVGAVTTTIGGVVAGTGPLTLQATGNMSSTGGGDGGLGLRLNQATNTFVGDVTITSGLVSYAHNLSFGDAANKIILNGGGLLDNNANIALARDIEVLAGGGTFRGYGSINVAWSGAITGSGSINRTDGGTLTLSGNLSGYSGTYNNQGGNTTLTGTASTIGGNWNLAAGTTTVNSTANQTLAGNLTGAGTFTKDGTGILTLSGTSNHTGNTTITAGTIRQGEANVVSFGGTLTVNGTGVYDLNGFNASVGSLAGVATGIVRDDAAGTGTTTLSLTNAGSIPTNIRNGATRTVALRATNGNGAFLLTNGSNNFSGGIVLTNSGAGTRMSPGTVTAGAYGTGPITIGESPSDKAGIYFANATSLSNPIIFNTALGTDRVGIRADAAVTLSGAITANLAPATFTSNAATAGSLLLTGQITGDSGLVLDITSLGAAATSFNVTLGNSGTANNYAGHTVINLNAASGKSATLTLGAPNQIPDGAGRGNVVINSNGSGVGRLNMGGFNETINGLSGNGTVDGVSGAPVLTVGGNNATATFSGSIVNTAGSLALVKTGSGTQTLSGSNSFSGGATVSNGTLIATSASSLGVNSGLTVGNGATFAYQPTAAGALNLGTGAINLASGSRVRTALGGTLSQSAIISTAAAVTVAGPVTLDVFVIPGSPPVAGTHDLITAASGLNNATYSIGSVYNAPNYMLTGLTQSDTAVRISTTAATPLTTHYWKGGYSDGNNIWAVSNGSTASNWATDVSGTNTSLTPGPDSTVIFSATGATNQGDMILGANMSVGGIVVNDTNAVVLNNSVYGHTLTTGAGGLQINSGAGAVTIGVPTLLGAEQSWLNNSGSLLTVAGTVANGGYTATLGGSGNMTLTNVWSGTGGLTKTGAGTLTLGVSPTYTGLTTLTGGKIALNASNDLVNTTVDINGGMVDFGSLTAASFGALQGTQNLSLLNGSSAPVTLTVGANNATTSYAGALSGTGASLVKVGTGNLTLTGANTYDGTTTVSRGVLFLGGASPIVLGNVVMNGPDQTFVRMQQPNQFGAGVVAGFTTNSGSWNRLEFFGKSQTLAGITTGTLTTQGGGVVQNSEANGVAGSPATLTLNVDSSHPSYPVDGYVFNGHLRDMGTNAPGMHPLSLTKTGTGTQTLVGNVIAYSGATTLSQGRLILRNTTTAFDSLLTTISSGTVLEFNTSASGNTQQLNALGQTITGTGVLEKTGPGQLWFGGNGLPVFISMSSGGLIDVKEGILRNEFANGNWSANLADMNIASGATVNVWDANITVDGLTGSGTVDKGQGNTHVLTVGVDNQANATFDGVIRNSSGTLAFTKVGTGTQTLTGTNLYTGSTTVSGGKLQLDFATGGTTNIISPSSAVVMGGGTLEIKGGSGESNAQTFNGISGTGNLVITPNGATQVDVNVGAINTTNGSLNFVGSDATVGGLGTANFLTSTTTTGNDGTTRLGGHLWNGTNWASTSLTGGNHVVPWVGTYQDLTTDGNDLTNPTSDLRIIDGAANGTAATYSANTTAQSLLMTAPTYATTIDLGTNTLTLGNGAGATGAIGSTTGSQALIIGATAGQGFLTAGTTAATSGLVINNESSSLVTVNSVISNNAASGVVSLTTAGAVTLNGVNTYTGSTTVTEGTLTIGGSATLGAGTYAGAISNLGAITYASNANQTWSGVISGTGNLAFLGGGTIIMSGANTYSGTTTVSAGTLRLGNNAGLGNSSLTTVGTGATLDLAGFASGRPVAMSGTGVGAVGALHNSSTTTGASIGAVTLTGDASASSAVTGGADTAKLLSMSALNLGGNKLTLSSGAFFVGIQNITSGDIDINNGATLYSTSVGSIVAATGTITINTGGRLETRDTNNTGAGTVHTIALNGGILSRGQITGNNGGGAGTLLKNNITVDAVNGGSILNTSSGGFGLNYRLSGSISGSGPLTLGGAIGVEFQGDASGYTGTATGTGGTITFNPGIATQTFAGNLAGGQPVLKSGSNTTILSGNNTYTGTTTVGAGTLVLGGSNTSSTSAFTVSSGATLRLDYGTNNNRKIGSGVLTLSGGSIELTGGSFEDGVASTTLTAATNNTITRTTGSAILNLGAITINAAARLNLAQSGIAKTSNANNAQGVLGSWATIGGNLPAMNDGTGLIVAATTTDLTRLSSGSKVIADGASDNVRFIEGTGSAGNFTLGAATTTINSLMQSSEGGTSAASVDLALQTLALNSVTVGTGAGALTIGTALNNGTLKAAGTSLEFRDFAGTGITVNSIIADGTGSTQVRKFDPGTMTFSGTSSYTGGTVVDQGTLTANLGTTAGARFPFGSGLITLNAGSTLRMFAGSTANAMTFVNPINLNGATLTAEDAVQTYTGSIALTGANTVNVSYAAKDAIFSGIVSGAGSLTKASAGLLRLSNANTYSGGTSITGGTLLATHTDALGTSGRSVTINNAALTLASDVAVSSKNLTLANTTSTNTITLDRGNQTTTWGNFLTNTGTSAKTLAVNLGAAVNVPSTLAFSGAYTPQSGGAGLTFNVGAGVTVSMASASLTAGAQNWVLTKSGAGTLILPGWVNWDGAAATTLSAGTLELRGIMGDGTDFRALTASSGSTLRLATDAASSDFMSGVTAASGMNIEGGRITSGATSGTRTLGTLSLGGALNVSRAATITGAGTTTIAFNGATTLTANATLNVGANATLNLGAISGNFTQAKEGAGTWSIFGANSSTGAITVNGGVLNLTGASGTAASATAFAINNGASLTLNNASGANNTNRIAGTVTMNGGSFNFTHTAGALNYSETVGNLTIGGGINTIATSQAATGQTSILTFGTLSRTAGVVNFSGPGLGVDGRNRILFTGGVTSGQPIGTWATYNGTDYAAYDSTNGVVPLTAYTDVTRLESGSKVIANTSANNVRIIEGTGVAPASITLAAPITTINTLNQSASGGTSAATIDPDATNNTLATNSILVSAGAGSLTIGTTVADGNLRAAGTALQVIENSSSGSTINSLITNGTAASSFTKSGSGLLTLTASNTYTGVTTIDGGILAVSVMANGGANSGIGAAAVAAANLVLSDGTLRYTGNSVSSNRGFTIAAGTTGAVDVATSGQTLTISGGIAATTGNLVKTGAGTLLLNGQSQFTGTTTVSGGVLAVDGSQVNNRLTNNHQVSVGNAATFEVRGVNALPSGANAVDMTVNGGGTFSVVSGGSAVIGAGGQSHVHMRNLTLNGGTVAFSYSGGGSAYSGESMQLNGSVTVIGTAASSIQSSGANSNTGLALNGNSLFTVNDVTSSTAVDLTVAAEIEDNDSAGDSLTKAGAGTMSLQAVNTYTGATNVLAGVLSFSGSGTIYNNNNTATVSVAPGAQIVASATTNNVLGFGSGATWNISGTFNSSGGGAQTFPGTVILNNGTLSGVANGTFGSFLTNAAYTTTITANGSTNTINSANFGMSNGSTLALNTPLVADALSISSPLGLTSQTGALTKTGLGTVTLTGVSIYTGSTTLNQGTVVMGTGGTISPSSTITVNSGATLRFNRSDTWGNHTATTSSPIVVNAGGTLASNATFNTLVDPTLNGGTMTLNGGASANYPAFAIKGTLTVGGSSASAINVGTGSNNLINIGPSGTAGTLTVNVADATSSPAADLTINAVLQNNWNTAGTARIASTLSKTGAGTLTLSAANTYSGGTSVSQGTLTVATGGTLGAVTGTLAVSNSNTGEGTDTVLNLSAAADTTTGSLSGTIAVPSSGVNTATINTQAGRTFTVNQTAAGSFAGGIAGSGDFVLGASSTNTLTLTGANTYTGTTTVAAGTLALVGGSQASPITVSSGASLSFAIGSPTTSSSSFNVTAGTIKVTGTPTLDSHTLIASSTGITGTPTLDAPISVYLLKKYDDNSLRLISLYQDWADTNDATGGPAADTDGDGYSNLMEYAFGTDPAVNSPGSIAIDAGVVTATGQPILVEENGVYYAVFGRRKDHVAAGLTYTVQFTAGLDQWTDSVTVPTVIATDGTIDAVRVPFPNFVASPSGPKKPYFFRVEIEK